MEFAQQGDRVRYGLWPPPDGTPAARSLRRSSLPLCGMKKVVPIFGLILGVCGLAAHAQTTVQVLVDLEIVPVGKVSVAEVVLPPMASKMAKPLEDAVLQWDLSKVLSSHAVGHRTSSAVGVVHLPKRGANKQISVRLVSLGPRLKKPYPSPLCLVDLRAEDRTGYLWYEVSVDAQGKAVEVMQGDSNMTTAGKLCAVEFLRVAHYKPETVGGRGVPGKVKWVFGFKSVAGLKAVRVE